MGEGEKIECCDEKGGFATAVRVITINDVNKSKKII